jgi:cytochrome c-type biogenesis protein CcmH
MDTPVKHPHDTPIDAVKRQLLALTELHQSGALPADQYQTSKAGLERKLLDLVLQSAPGSTVSAPADDDQKPGFALIASIFIGIVLIAVAGYSWKGSPSQLATGPASAQTAGQTDQTRDDSRSPTSSQIAGMIDSLAQHLKDNPQDADGWTMMGRALSVMNRHPEALKAYEKAVALRKDDASLLADYADSLAVNNNRNLAGEPMKWVARSLKLDPANIKALTLAGSDAFDRKDYKLAIKFWAQVVQIGPADSQMVQQVASGLAQARELAGLPADGGKGGASSPKPSSSAPSNNPPPATASAANTSITGTLTLAEALRSQTSPNDTVFIFARAAQGPRMPLAIVRKQVKDLPLTFTLDDSTAMSEATKLSSVSQVVVSARISKSGDAMPQPGDLSVQSAAVNVGTQGLKLEIK